VKRQAIFLARWAGRGAFKATALVLAFVIIVALWLWNASLLTTAADQNLRIIKTLTQLLPPDWAAEPGGRMAETTGIPAGSLDAFFTPGTVGPLLNSRRQTTQLPHELIVICHLY